MTPHSAPPKAKPAMTNQLEHYWTIINPCQSKQINFYSFVEALNRQNSASEGDVYSVTISFVFYGLYAKSVITDCNDNMFDVTSIMVD